MFYVTDKIDGVIDEEVSFKTKEEAEEFIYTLEEEDKEEGRYTKGFYVIIEK